MKRCALSIRQPYAELILRGEKLVEYRTIATRKRQRVYIYASRQPGPSEVFVALGVSPEDLPTGVLVGTVMIAGCEGKKGDYRWLLRSPKRFRRPLAPQGRPQPVFFFA